MTHLTGKPGRDLKTFSDAHYHSQTFLKFNEKGFCTLIRFKDLAADEVIAENIFSYHSQNGRRLMFSIYGRDSNEMFRRVFRYDSNGKVNKEEISYPRKSQKATDIVEYLYDDSGRVVKKTTKKAASNQTVGVESSTYDEGGHLLRRETVSTGNRGAKKTVTEKWQYDDKGRKTEYQMTAEGKTETTTFSYTADGAAYEEIRSIDGKQQSRKVYHYENGVCTAELSSDGEDRLKSIVRIICDSKGNWISKVAYRFGEQKRQIEVFQVEKRQIQYRR